MPTDQARLLTLLSGHIGAAAGITADAIATELRIAPRQVRRLVTELRLDGVAVCGHPRSGYFIAANAAELELTCLFLRHRALCSLTLEARLRKLPLPDLIGQLHLQT